MPKFFEIIPSISKSRLHIYIDYDIDMISNSRDIHGQKQLPPSFFENFQYKAVGSGVVDMIPNSLSWYIISQRYADVLKAVCRPEDFRLFALPEKLVRQSSALRGFSILSIVRNLPCLDMQRSDLSWDKDEAGKPYILGINKCVLRQEAIAKDAHLFLIDEYPFFGVASEQLVAAIEEFRPVDLRWKAIESK
jgi:hypothetical protein